MRTTQHQLPAKHLSCGLLYLVLFCAATSLASPAQVFTTLVNFDGYNASGLLSFARPSRLTGGTGFGCNRLLA